MESLTLGSLLEEETAIVTEVKSTGEMRLRLYDIGIIEGTSIKCLFKSPHKDPIAYKIHNAVFALRSEDAKDIMVVLE
jgi:ferrous iron transport protein A